MGLRTSPMPPAKWNTALRRDSSAVSAPTAMPQRRKDSIATDGSLRAIDRQESLWLILPRRLAESLFGFLHVVQGEFAGFHQVRHHQLGSAPKERQQFVNQSALGIFARDRSLENIRVADPLDAAEGLLPFQAIDGGLHRSVSRPSG